MLLRACQDKNQSFLTLVNTMITNFGKWQPTHRLLLSMIASKWNLYNISGISCSVQFHYQGSTCSKFSTIALTVNWLSKKLCIPKLVQFVLKLIFKMAPNVLLAIMDWHLIVETLIGFLSFCLLWKGTSNLNLDDHTQNPFFLHECQVGLNGCDEHARCTNVRGGYRCECVGDYYGSGLSCQREFNWEWLIFIVVFKNTMA